MYIAFEGIDGSGKTKQIELLVRSLLFTSVNPLVTKELGSHLDPACEKLREIFLSDSYNMDDLAGEYILAACSIQHNEKVIKPAIEKSKLVISDRSIESNLAYGYAQFDEETINSIFLQDKRRLHPDIVILLDIDPEVSWNRLRSRKREAFVSKGVDRIEKKGLAFQVEVRKEYLKRAKELDSYLVIDIKNDSIDEVHTKVLEVLKGYL